MEYRVCALLAFRLAGVTARVPLRFEGANPKIAELACGAAPSVGHEAAPQSARRHLGVRTAD